MTDELLFSPGAAFPKRSETMYLRTFEAASSPERTRSRSVGRVADPLRIDDIEGTRPRVCAPDLRKPPQTYDDVDGCHPRVLIRAEVNKPNNRIYDQRDIDRSWPIESTFKTARVVNPLDPVYKLPSVEPLPVLVTPGQRDPVSVADIEGTSPRRLPSRRAPRNPADGSDIEGSVPHYVPEHRRRRDLPRNPLDAADINHEGEFRSTRPPTNPLSPRYRYDVPPGTRDVDWTIGEVPGARPRTRHYAVRGAVDKMSTRDIAAAYAGWQPSTVLQRSQFIHTNFVGDIPGAQAGTRPVLRTARVTDPLAPRYVLLDGTTASRPHTPLALRTPPGSRAHTAPAPAAAPAPASASPPRTPVSPAAAPAAPAPSRPGSRGSAGSKAGPSAAERRAQDERQADIEAVRQLQI